MDNLTGKKSRIENDLNLVNGQEEKESSELKQESSDENNVFENLAASLDQTRASTSQESEKETDMIRRRRLEKLHSPAAQN